MNDQVTQVFGYGVTLIAVGLLLWQWFSFSVKPSQASDDDWLKTPVRKRRRFLMAVLVLCVGILIVLESHGVIRLDSPQALILFVLMLGIISIVLLVLSFRDVSDMARNAEKQALKDLESALREHQQKNNQQDP